MISKYVHRTKRIEVVACFVTSKSAIELSAWFGAVVNRSPGYESVTFLDNRGKVTAVAKVVMWAINGMDGKITAMCDVDFRRSYDKVYESEQPISFGDDDE